MRSNQQISCSGWLSVTQHDSQYSLVSFLFVVLLLTVPPRAQPSVKVGDTCSPVPYDSSARSVLREIPKNRLSGYVEAKNGKDVRN